MNFEGDGPGLERTRPHLIPVEGRGTSPHTPLPRFCFCAQFFPPNSPHFRGWGQQSPPVLNGRRERQGMQLMYAKDGAHGGVGMQV